MARESIGDVSMKRECGESVRVREKERIRLGERERREKER